MSVLLLLVFCFILQPLLNKEKGLCPNKGNKHDERTRGHDLGGVAEDTGFVHLDEKEAEG